MPNAIVWFRNDLRLRDNPALNAALRAGLTPIPVYIHAPHEEGDWVPGAASDAWRHRSLHALDTDLRVRGSQLHVFRGNSSRILQMLLAETNAKAIFWNRRYEPFIQQRDADIKRDLRALGIRAESFNGSLLFEPWELQTKTGDPFRVFAPFWRAARAQWRLAPVTEAPHRFPASTAGPSSIGIDALGLAPRVRWDSGFWTEFTPGEAGAQRALKIFADDAAVSLYRSARDIPSVRGTSKLSPHLHFGEISPARIVHELERTGAGAALDLEAYVRELGWREFAHHVLHHFPHTPQRNFNPRFDRFAWAEVSMQTLRAWQQGRTGVPIVDAGLRELWTTGWMHNRVRMIVASFLTKNLRLHWLHGARWFWETLVDADLANNSLGWQWVAGTGVDAAPYFRVFNPILQARKFDPEGNYIARWVPELAEAPSAARIEPWRHKAAPLPGVDPYPRQPMVDLLASRERAIAAFSACSHRPATNEHLSR
ncbi:deoxyribodipyrimidine photo-lyase [Dokdonella sp.]|uniref:cryptochrome/photolyase family protein n=1 Tax=Dokdonella sp. TaxID=2291710 RepID=UPI00261BBBDC|nr:deoxyribodipyrimidine photo-lyase [Dokdonella sp.]